MIEYIIVLAIVGFVFFVVEDVPEAVGYGMMVGKSREQEEPSSASPLLGDAHKRTAATAKKDGLAL